MSEITAQLSQAEQAAWEQQLEKEARLQQSRTVTRSAGLESMPGPPTPFDPLRPVSAMESDHQNAIGLVRRGVQVAPFAESTPLVPLYAELGQTLPAQLKIAHEQQSYNFVLAQLTFSLQLSDDEAPDYAEFVVQLHDNVEGARASRAIEVFPQRSDVHWFKANASLSVALDASMKFAVSAPLQPLPQIPEAEAKVGAQAGGQAQVLLGPFQVSAGHTELEVSGAGDRNIGWRYRVGKALEGQNDFKSFLVLKVAKETERVELRANIGVRTYRRSWRSLWLRKHMPILRAHAVMQVELPAPAKEEAEQPSG